MKAKKRLHDYSALMWDEFYDSMEWMEDGTPVYVGGRGNSPVFLCLHGAGHSA